MWTSQKARRITSIDPVLVIGAPPSAPVPITIDQQEKKPILFPPDYATVTVGHLKIFDYAVTGDKRWGIERKSIADLIGSFSGQHAAREIRKIEKARAAFDPAWPIIYMIEGAKREIITHNWMKHDKATPQWFISHIFKISLTHGVQFDFCETRQEFALWTYRWLKTRWQNLQKRGLTHETKRVSAGST